MERTLNIKQKHSKDYQSSILLSPSDIEYLFFEILQKHKKTTKIHYIISNKTSENKDKNPCKKQVCNQQEINLL